MALTLFPRRGRPSAAHPSRQMAHRILDRVRAGSDVRADLIAWALKITGDL